MRRFERWAGVGIGRPALSVSSSKPARVWAATMDGVDRLYAATRSRAIDALIANAGHDQLAEQGEIDDCECDSGRSPFRAASEGG